MTFASLAQFFSKKTIDKQKRIGNRSVGANNFQIAVARSCRRIVAGFLLPSIIDGGSPATAMPGAVYLQLLAPATRGRTASGWRVLTLR